MHADSTLRILYLLYPKGQQQTESFLLIQRKDPMASSDNRSGMAYKFNVRKMSNVLLPSFQIEPDYYFSDERDTKFKQAISQHLNHYIKCLALIHEQIYILFQSLERDFL